MTITEAKKRCDELQDQIKEIEKKYFLTDRFGKYLKEKKIKPLYDEWSKLMTLITKAENETNLYN